MSSENRTRQSSFLNQKIRKAEFVQIKEEAGDFKYGNEHSLNRKWTAWIANQKRRINTVMQKPRLWMSFTDWQKIRKDLTTWLVEAAIEGFSANFATHFLLGFPFDPWTMMAHGLAIKHVIDIYGRLKNNGSASKLPKRDK